MQRRKKVRWRGAVHSQMALYRPKAAYHSESEEAGAQGSATFMVGRRVRSGRSSAPDRKFPAMLVAISAFLSDRAQSKSSLVSAPCRITQRASRRACPSPRSRRERRQAVRAGVLSAPRLKLELQASCTPLRSCRWPPSGDAAAAHAGRMCWQLPALPPPAPSTPDLAQLAPLTPEDATATTLVMQESLEAAQRAWGEAGDNVAAAGHTNTGQTLRQQADAALAGTEPKVSGAGSSRAALRCLEALVKLYYWPAGVPPHDAACTRFEATPTYHGASRLPSLHLPNCLHGCVPAAGRRLILAGPPSC